MADPDILLGKIENSSFKYGLLESQLWKEEHTEEERSDVLQHTISDKPVWRPTADAIEQKFTEHGFEYTRYDYAQFLEGGPSIGRALWKFWKKGEGNVKDNTMASGA